MNPIMLYMGGSPQSDFVSVWDTTKAGTSASNQVTLPFLSTLSYAATILWGDGNYNTAFGSGNMIFPGETVAVTHTYASPGVYTIKISGIIPGWQFNNGGDKLKILEIKKWGTLTLGTTQGSYFYGCANLVVNNVTDVLNLTGTTNLTSLFRDCSKIASVNRILEWNTSNVTNMSNLFSNCTLFNQDLSTLDTHNVATISSMFQGCSLFNQPLVTNGNAWNVSKVTLMTSTFQNATAFNQNIGGWVTTAVTSLSNTFAGATSFNQNLNGWDVSKVTIFTSAFNAATAFNNGLAAGVSGSMTWTLSITATFNMGNMFLGASSFNQDISSWNMTKCTAITSMFSGATLFNQPLNTWDVSSIPSLNSTFLNASSFNQPLNNWNTVTCNNLISTFNGAIAFNQNIGSWNISVVTTASNIFSGKTPANFSGTNLDAIYNGWTNRLLITTVNFGGGTIKQTQASIGGRLLLSKVAATVTITAASSGTGGVIRLTTGTAHGFLVGTPGKIYITTAVGTLVPIGGYNVNVIDATNLDLVGTVFGSGFAAGGIARVGYGWTVADGLLTVTSVVSSGGGTTSRIATNAHGFGSIGTVVSIYVYGINGVPIPNAVYSATVAGTTTVDIPVAFSGAYTSGGNIVLP